MPAMMPLAKRAEGDLELPPENKDRIIVMTMLNEIPMDKPITSDKYTQLINKAESIAATTRFSLREIGLYPTRFRGTVEPCTV